MHKFLRGMLIAAVVFAMTGCSMGKISIGNLSPTAKSRFEIFGSTYDESFQAAHRAILESDLEIFSSDKRSGTIKAGLNSREDSIQGDTRSFTTNFADMKFVLRKSEAGNLLFEIESKSSMSGQKYVDRFMEKYSEYVKFVEVGHESSPFLEKKVEQNKTGLSETIITEARTADPISTVKIREFSKEEVIDIQNLLTKLGYDPGPADGTINSRTRAAIEKFKVDLNP